MVTRTVQENRETSSSGLAGEEQAETSSRGWGVLGLNPMRGMRGKAENPLVERRPLVIGESSELILLSQHVGKAFWQEIGALTCWFHCRSQLRVSTFPLGPLGKKKAARRKREFGGKRTFAASFHLDVK